LRRTRRETSQGRIKKLRLLIRWYFSESGQSRHYWENVANATDQTIEKALAEHDLEVPRPLPANVEAWGAFLRVADIRRLGAAAAGGPAWADIAEVLKLSGQWNAGIQQKLEICFRELLKGETEVRKRKAAAARNKARGK
jgi:hypothetical protein